MNEIRRKALQSAIALYTQELEDARARYELYGAEHHLIRAEELAKALSLLEMRA
jgi:hypothetical protein